MLPMFICIHLWLKISLTEAFRLGGSDSALEYLPHWCSDT